MIRSREFKEIVSNDKDNDDEIGRNERMECHGQQWIFVAILNGYKKTMMDKYGPVMVVSSWIYKGHRNVYFQVMFFLVCLRTGCRYVDTCTQAIVCFVVLGTMKFGINPGGLNVQYIYTFHRLSVQQTSIA